MIAIRENLIRNKSDDVSQTFHVVLEVSQHIGPVPFGTLCQLIGICFFKEFLSVRRSYRD